MKADPDSRLEFTVDISRELSRKLSRVGTVLSDRYGRRCTFEEALDAMSEVLLHKLDPVRKQKAPPPATPEPRSRAKPESPRSPATPVPSHLKIQALRRDRNQCTHAVGGRERCGNKKRVDIFPVRQPARGGPPGLKDIATLCRHHSPKPTSSA